MTDLPFEVRIDPRTQTLVNLDGAAVNLEYLTEERIGVVEETGVSVGTHSTITETASRMGADAYLVTIKRMAIGKGWKSSRSAAQSNYFFQDGDGRIPTLELEVLVTGYTIVK